VQFPHAFADSLEGQRRRAERIFVGSEFDDAVQTELALDLRDGPSRLVGLECFNVCGNEGHLAGYQVQTTIVEKIATKPLKINIGRRRARSPLEFEPEFSTIGHSNHDERRLMDHRY
jgi:hypothetical protein